MFDVGCLSGARVAVKENDPRLVLSHRLWNHGVHSCEVIVVKLININGAKIDGMYVVRIEPRLAGNQHLEARQFLRAIRGSKTVIGLQDPLLWFGVIQTVQKLDLDRLVLRKKMDEHAPGLTLEHIFKRVIIRRLCSLWIVGVPVLEHRLERETIQTHMVEDWIDHFFGSLHRQNGPYGWR